MKPLVSILIVTHNRREHLVRCLESCLQQTYSDIEILVFINGGCPETTAAVVEAAPEARVFKTHRNLGFFPVLNLAVANANGEYLLTLDDDACLESPRVIAGMLEAFDWHDDLGAVTCNIKGPFEAEPVERDRYVHTFKTGFTMMPREVFDEWVGYYPDVFFRSAGESYVATALWDNGKPILQLADVTIQHQQTSQGRSDWDWMFYGTRSQILLVLMRDPWFVIAPRLSFKFLRGIMHAMRRKQLLACLAGWGSAIFSIPTALRLRRPIRWSTSKRLRHIRSTAFGPTDSVESQTAAHQML